MDDAESIPAAPIARDSLAATLDRVSEVLFRGRVLAEPDRVRIAEWIGARQGLPGAYAAMFAPTPRDFTQGILVFTGEEVSSRAGTAHILGEEACRILVLLKAVRPRVVDALAKAQAGIFARVREAERRGCPMGTYCCGTCSCAFWRHLTVAPWDGRERRLAAGMRLLRESRQGNGRWQRFPFWYALLALSDIDLPAAGAERQHAAPACERALKRLTTEGRFSARRTLLAERILASV